MKRPAFPESIPQLVFLDLQGGPFDGAVHRVTRQAALVSSSFLISYLDGHAEYEWVDYRFTMGTGSLTYKGFVA